METLELKTTIGANLLIAMCKLQTELNIKSFDIENVTDSDSNIKFTFNGQPFEVFHELHGKYFNVTYPESFHLNSDIEFHLIDDLITAIKTP